MFRTFSNRREYREGWKQAKEGPICLEGRAEIQSRFDEESAQIDVRLPVKNTDTEEKLLTLEYGLTFEGDHVAGFSKALMLPPGAVTAAHLPIAFAHPRLFMPGKPSSYQLEVKLFVDGKPAGAFEKGFALKHVAVERDVFLLNGRAVFLTAMVIHPFVEAVGSGFTDNMYYRAAYRAKQMGFLAVVSEQPPGFFQEVCESMGLLLLEPGELPKTAAVYEVRTAGADTAGKLLTEQALELCRAYDAARRDVGCGAFCVSDQALFDGFGRACPAARALGAVLSAPDEGGMPAAAAGEPLGQRLYVMRCTNKVYAFAGADRCKAFVDGHFVSELTKLLDGVFIGELPERYVEYTLLSFRGGRPAGEVVLNPPGRAVQLILKAEISGRNIKNDRTDMVPVTAYAVDGSGTIDIGYEGEIQFIPFSSAIIRGKPDYTQENGIGSDPYGNVVTISGAAAEAEKYVIPFRSGIATVLVSAKSNSRFTGLAARCQLGSRTEYLDY